MRLKKTRYDVLPAERSWRVYVAVLLLSEEGNQYAGSYGGADYSGDVGSHAIVQYMVLYIVSCGDFIAYAACHRYGTQTGGTDKRIDFLLAE